MPATIQIFLDNLTNEGVCYAGQTIAGRVECNFSSEKKLRAVRIKFEGKCNTNWNSTEREYDAFHKEQRTKHVNYRAEEIYFLHEYNLAGDGNEFRLPAGKYSYPFSYILPQLLPSSFENDLGKIRYTIKARVDCPWRFDDTATALLRLISPLDLNNYQHLRQPVAICVDKTLFSWNFSSNSDPLIFKISLPVTAYAAGQQVQVGAHVENHTNVNVEKVNFKITKETEFIVHYPSTQKRNSEQTLVSRSEGGIGAHSEKQWTSILTIPTDNLIPNMVHCKLINVNYRLHGEVVVQFPHTNLTAVVPLMLGNIPLANINTGRPLVQTNIDHPYTSAPMVPNPAAASAPPLSGNLASAPPPTYEESQFQAGFFSNNRSNNTIPEETKTDVEDSFEWIS